MLMLPISCQVLLVLLAMVQIALSKSVSTDDEKLTRKFILCEGEFRTVYMLACSPRNGGMPWWFGGRAVRSTNQKRQGQTMPAKKRKMRWPITDDILYEICCKIGCSIRDIRIHCNN